MEINVNEPLAQDPFAPWRALVPDDGTSRRSSRRGVVAGRTWWSNGFICASLPSDLPDDPGDGDPGNNAIAAQAIAAWDPCAVPSPAPVVAPPRVPCSECKGVGSQTRSCPECVDGWVRCDACDGTGSVECNLDHPHPVCSRLPCPECGGADDRKRTKCEGCDGSGRKTHECGACDGAGRVLSAAAGGLLLDARVLDHLASVGAVAHAARVDDVDGLAFRAGDVIGFVVSRRAEL